MPVFGQVWLWSLAGFLVGALLCWALVARPARRRAIELEDRLDEVRRTRQEPVATAYQPRPFDEYQREDVQPADGLTAPPEASPEPHEPPPLTEPEPVESTQLMAAPPVAEHPPVEAPPEVEPEWYPVAERFDVSRLDATESPDDEHLVDDLPDEDSGTIFTQHTTPISGALIRRLDDDTSLVDDLDDESDDIDPHRGHFADALTPDDEEESLRAAEDEPATRYMPAVPDPADEAAPPALPQRHTADTEALPRRTPSADALPGRTPSADADALPSHDAPRHSSPADATPERAFSADTEALPRRGSVDADALPQRGSSTDADALPTRGSTIDALFGGGSSADALPARGSTDADALPKRDSSADAEALPKRSDGDGLPKRTPGGESRRPVGEATAFSPSPNMFTPAQPDADRARHSLPSGPASEPTVYAPAVEPAARTRTEPDPAAHTRSEPEPARTRVESEPAARTRTEPESRPEPEPTVFAPSVPEPVAEEAAARTGVLPKRVPKKPGDRFPFGVRTGAADPAPAPTATSEPTPNSATDAEPERARSLFEPITPADEPGATKALPAPSRPKRGASRPSQVLPGGVDTFVPPGPFGPGSAMPLPGGNSPSSEYRVKASVTALRYCSPESPKFDRTVAEVWFRSVADAERVGFRPLG